jgi:two-component system, chemotaxis family, sensor kinase CheA
MAEHGGGGRDGGDKAREEFFSEAQELVDGLGRDVVAIDEGLKRGAIDPELVNDVFRAVHTLKGLAGLFGATRMTGLSHELEDVLDDLRLGRTELNASVLDLLFEAVELYGRILAWEHGAGAEPAAEVEALLVRLGNISQQRAGASTGLVAQYDLDPGLLGVLTEYEEHRLRTNIQAGLSLYRIKVRFALATIDSALDDLKARTRPHGEIITYLPTGSGADVETIELEILMASHASLELLRTAVSGQNIGIEEVKRRSARVSATGAPSAMPPPSNRLSELPSAPPPTMVFNALGEPGSDVPTGFHDRVSLSPPVPLPPEVATAPEDVLTGARDMSLRSVSQTVRVDIRKLDRLMAYVGELAIVRTAIARLAERVRGRPDLRELGIELQRLHRSFDRQLGAMQSGILEVRMVPLGQVFDKLARVVRQISREHDKQVNLVITGAETEIDKLIVEELSDPLMHMIRNAIDHGIESREERIHVGKPPIGTIALNAFQKGNHVVIEVEDDGRGMDPAALLATATRRGIVSASEARELTSREILALAFMPGFTTREVATDLSGRGVGLDVVKTNIGKLGGAVDVASDIGIGTKMTITLPITLAIMSVLLVEVGARLFAIPLANVDEAISLDERLVRSLEGREVLTVRGASLPICRLARLFSIADLGQAGARSFVVIASVGDRRLGFVVDRLVGQEDIVIKALGKSLKGVRGFAGATELGDQRMALVLDAGSLIEEVLASDKERLFSPGVEGRS